MWLRIARLGTEFGCIDKICFFYRLREGSFSNKARMMWESGSKVIERAFRPDSRVNDPEPDFAQGGNIERKTMVRFRYALACCSLALVEHDVQTAINIFDLECSKINKAGDPVIIADALRHNIWNASSIESGDWVSLWPIIGTALFDFLSYVERRLNIPGYGGECLRSLMGIDKLEAIRESTSYRIGRTITRFKFW